MKAWIYILRLKSQGLYSGSTTNLTRRVKEHFAGHGCRTTRLDPPVALIYSEEFNSIEDAEKREKQIKGWTRAKKEALIRGDMADLKRLSKGIMYPERTTSLTKHEE